MKTLLTLLLASVALACSAQDPSVLPPSPAMNEMRMQHAGLRLAKAGTFRHAAIGCFVAGGIVGALVAQNTDRDGYEQSSLDIGMLAAGAVLTVGLSFTIVANNHEVRAGRILQGRQFD